MTRIIAGVAGGRTLRTPPGSGTRPTSDRVREALFSALDARDALRGRRVLDLYAGSGALGLEAASRGAAGVVLVESDRRAAQVIAHNVRELALPGVRVVRSTVAAALAGEPGEDAADLVLVDPPYDVPEELLVLVLDRLAAGWLAPGGLLVVERSTRSPEPAWPEGIGRVGRPRTYGDTTVWLAEREGHPRSAPSAQARPPVRQNDRMTDYDIPRPEAGDVVDLIVADHRLLEDLLRDLRDATADREGARTALAELLIAHGESEEANVYPALNTKRAISADEVEHGEEEHAEGNEALLALLECKGTDTQKFDDAVEELATALNHHIGEEEQTILNPARTEVSEDVRRQLGADWVAERNRLLDEGCASVEQVRTIVERAVKEGVLAAEEAREEADAIEEAAKKEAEEVEEAAKEDAQG